MRSHASTGGDGYICRSVPAAYLPFAQLLTDLPARCKHSSLLNSTGNISDRLLTSSITFNRYPQVMGTEYRF